MPDPSAPPCVLVVADRERVGELVEALSELAHVQILISSGGDDTIDLFESRRPVVVVLTATLAVGDARSLITTLRGMVRRSEVAIVVIGDDAGPIRTALDALDLAPDRFVTRPLSAKALRFAVSGGIESVRLTGSSPRLPPPPLPVAMGTIPGLPAVEDPDEVEARKLLRTTLPGLGDRGASDRITAVRPPASVPVPVGDSPSAPSRAELRARWAALADAIGDDDGDEAQGEGAPASRGPREGSGPRVAAVAREASGPREGSGPRVAAVTREGSGPRDAPGAVAEVDERTEPVDVDAEPRDPATALPPPVLIKPRRRNLEPGDVGPTVSGLPGPTDDQPPVREPTLILREPEPAPAVARTSTGDGRVVVAARTSSDELWSEPMPIAELVDREPRPQADDRAAAPVRDDLGLPLSDIPDELGPQVEDARAASSELDGRDDVLDRRPPIPNVAELPGASEAGLLGGTQPRDFARELRAKMSMMAQRLFQGSDAPAPGPVDHAPRHDHHTEIDLSVLGDEPALGNGAEIEARAVPRPEPREHVTGGSWDSQVRERGLPDTGTIVRGVSDAAMLLARMFAQGATGRVGFRRDEVETIVYFDHGRPVFASSNEPRDRMGELLAREGKITASQYERCQTVVAESGRRMGEILVDLGYLKRRELLPAVRRHVEDLVYSLFGWERGAYYVVLDAEPSAERIRLSRHSASLILEGIRRKLDRTSLERLIGPTSTVIEVRDRERLGGIINLGDLAVEERGALAAFDGQADLAQVARTAGVDIADVLPLAWGLCVLGLATARRTDAEVGDESAALVGETDLAIDRERVRARWQLVTDADYFALLGVRRDATGFEIRRAYQAARRDFAADCFPGELRRELARELDDIAHVLDEAFRVLRDDHLRQTYLANLVDQ